MRAAMGVGSTSYRRRYFRNGRGRPQHQSVEHIFRSHAEEGLCGWNLSSSGMVSERPVNWVYAELRARSLFDIVCLVPPSVPQEAKVTCSQSHNTCLLPSELLLPFEVLRVVEKASIISSRLEYNHVTHPRNLVQSKVSAVRVVVEPVFVYCLIRHRRVYNHTQLPHTSWIRKSSTLVSHLQPTQNSFAHL